MGGPHEEDRGLVNSRLDYRLECTPIEADMNRISGFSTDADFSYPPSCKSGHPERTREGFPQSRLRTRSFASTLRMTGFGLRCDAFKCALVLILVLSVLCVQRAPAAPIQIGGNLQELVL